MTCRTAAPFVLALLTVCAVNVFAQAGGPEPPPAAFTACEGKKAGDKAESVTPDGRTITGACEEKDGRLFLRPDHPPQGSEGGPEPPPEAFAACEGKKAGDKAELAGPQGQKITGACEEKDGRLFLRPDHPPQRDDAGPQKRQQAD